jgi:hypothetical protein
MLPKVQVRTPVAMLQLAAFVPPSVHVPAGSVSVTVTLLEDPVPPALTVMVKVAVPPALIAELPDFTIDTSGAQFTVILAEALLLLVFVSTLALTVAVFEIGAGQSVGVVVRLRVIVFDVLEPMLPKLHVRTPAAMLQLAASAPPTVQVPEGSVSLSVTLTDPPMPPAVTVIVKIAVAPTLSGPLPVFVTETSGWQLTVMVAEALLLLVFVSPVALTVAVFAIDGQSPPTVARLKVTTFDVLDAIVPKLQESTPAAMLQLAASAPPRVHVPEGSVSDRVTLLDAPVPPALTVIVNIAV